MGSGCKKVFLSLPENPGVSSLVTGCLRLVPKWEVLLEREPSRLTSYAGFTVAKLQKQLLRFLPGCIKKWSIDSHCGCPSCQRGYFN